MTLYFIHWVRQCKSVDWFLKDSSFYKKECPNRLSLIFFQIIIFSKLYFQKFPKHSESFCSFSTFSRAEDVDKIKRIEIARSSWNTVRRNCVYSADFKYFGIVSSNIVMYLWGHSISTSLGKGGSEQTENESDKNGRAARKVMSLTKILLYTYLGNSIFPLGFSWSSDITASNKYQRIWNNYIIFAQK